MLKAGLCCFWFLLGPGPCQINPDGHHGSHAEGKLRENGGRGDEGLEWPQAVPASHRRWMPSLGYWKSSSTH